MAVSVARVYDALLELCCRWDMKLDVEGSRSVGLYNLAYRVMFKSCFDDGSNWRVGSQRQLCTADGSKSLFVCLQQLCTDLKFLMMFWSSVEEHSDAAKVVRDSGRNSLLVRIEAVAEEIANDLNSAIDEATREKYSSLRPQKLLNLLLLCQRKTDHFKAEVTQVLDYLSGCSYQVHFTGFNDWSMFVESVKETLRSIRFQDLSLDIQIYPLYNELELMRDYVRQVCFQWHTSDHHGNRDFLTYVESVTLSIANQSCNHWFNKTSPIVRGKAKTTAFEHLHWRICPANPDFLWLALKLLKDVSKMSHEECERFFFNLYVVSSSFRPLYEQVYSLVGLFLDSKLEDSHEDVQSLFAEISAALAEAALIMRKNCDSHEVIMKICLLKLEFLLKGQAISDRVNESVLQLRSYFEGLENNEEYWRQILELVERMPELESQCSLSNSAKIRLLFEIVLFKAEAFLIESLSSNATLTACTKQQIESLLDEIKYVKPVAAIYPLNDAGVAQMIYIQLEAVARRVTFYSYSFLANNVRKERCKKLILLLPELLHKFNIIKGQLKVLTPQFPMANFPKTYELGFFDFLVKNLRELLNHDPKIIAPVRYHVKEIQLHLESLKFFLIKVSESDIDHSELTVLVNHIMEVAYKVEYVVDSIEVDAHWQHFLLLNNLLEDIRLVNQQVSKIQEISYAAKVQIFTQVSCKMISQDTTPAVNEMVLDLGDDEQVIIDRLTRGSLQRDVVSIVGMPGIGKTTLAKRVYNHQSVMLHFHRRAWCTISQVYQKRELLLAVLSGIHELTDEEIHRMTNEDLESKLRRCLLKNKYLIVMDDVWDIAAWNCLKYSLPDDMNGSRILITSRLHDVALEIKPDRDPHFVRLFTDEESWKLLEKKIFQGDRCPEELLLVGKEIAQLCKGLPLAVVAIAGLLQKSEKRMDVWKTISERLNSGIINDPETRCMEILELSYKHLPEYLKACFLYLGAFLEDRDIPVKKLTRFWIAEGFIPNTVSKSLENVAEDYLMDLINRNLVMTSKKRSNGMVKACQLHDLLRDFCQLKAEEENYLQLITRFDEHYASFPSSDYGIEFEYDHLDPVTYEAYRLSIFLRRDHFVDTRPSGPNTHSLIFFACLDSEPKYPYDISFICHNFKLLRVLDLECINMGVCFPAEIELLLHLRYLAVCGYLRSLPPSIAKLWKLETLVVKGLRGKVILPSTIWQMTRLRHLHLDKYVFFDLQDEEFESSLQLDNLLSFSSPIFSYGQDTEKILKKFPNLLELRCVLLKSLDSSKECNQFPRLSFLTQMESLKIVYHRRVLDRSEFDFPFSLKKLTLSNFYLPWNHISVIGRLPNLEVLKLLSGMFDGEIWDMREEEFQQLKFLKLEALNIVEWNATCDQLPQLERLVLRNCKALEKVPYDLADITTLQMIEVHWCRESVEESAKEIGEATEDIKILINRS